MPSLELDLPLDPVPDPETLSKSPEAPPVFLLTVVSSIRYSSDPEPNPPALIPIDAETEAGTFNHLQIGD